MIGWEDEENASDGAAKGIGESVWSVEKNDVTCPLPPPLPRSDDDVGKSGGICRPRQIGVGKNDWVGPPRQTESDAYDVSSHCFSGSHPPLRPPYVSSDGFYLSHGPSLDPNHGKTHPSTFSPSRL